MNDIFRGTGMVLAAALGYALAGCITTPPAPPFDPASATLTIQPEPDSVCSATVVGVSTILTASHCIEPTALVVGIEGVPVLIHSVQRDLTDHALVQVQMTFENIAEILPDAVPVQKDRVRSWGNPGGMEDQYREGYVAGVCPVADCFPPQVKVPAEYVTTYAFPGWKGDSGAAVFNPAGKIVAVISTVHPVGPGYIPMGSLPFTFTAEQLAGIR